MASERRNIYLDEVTKGRAAEIVEANLTDRHGKPINGLSAIVRVAVEMLHDDFKSDEPPLETRLAESIDTGRLADRVATRVAPKLIDALASEAAEHVAEAIRDVRDRADVGPPLARFAKEVNALRSAVEELGRRMDRLAADVLSQDSEGDGSSARSSADLTIATPEPPPDPGPRPGTPADAPMTLREGLARLKAAGVVP